jgi:hypothetical protein
VNWSATLTTCTHIVKRDRQYQATPGSFVAMTQITTAANSSFRTDKPAPQASFSSVTRSIPRGAAEIIASEIAHAAMEST